MGPVRDLTASASRPGLVARVPLFLDAIKFQESAFALPFAFTGMVLAAGGLPTLTQFAWISVAMVGARTFGMAANRVVDRHIDALNPRTAGRHLPAGKLRVGDVAVPALVALGVFVYAASRLNGLALALAPVAAAYLALYPLTKRVTWSANLMLGWALAIAPAGAWIGVTGALTWQAVLLSLAVACWAGSFDILYHAQDLEFYRQRGLHSVPQRFGMDVALRMARGLDLAAVACLVGLGVWMGLAPLYFVGCAVAAGLLANKHRVVASAGVRGLGMAFFRTNAYVSTTVLAAALAGVYL